MRDISWYLDRAAAKCGSPSDYNLAKHLGTIPQKLFNYRNGVNLPQDDMMVRIAELAGASPAIALHELTVWRAIKGKQFRAAEIHIDQLNKLTGGKDQVVVKYDEGKRQVTAFVNAA